MMVGKYLRAWPMAALLTGLCASVQATTISENAEVLGSLCVGFDCNVGVDYSDNTLHLAENNLRVRFLDSSAANGAAKGWTLKSNDSANGGSNHFDFSLLGTDENGVILGEAAETPVFAFGTASDGYVRLGQNTTIIDGQVSIGRSDFLRSVHHVADPAVETDALNLRTMDAALLQTQLQIRRDRIAELNTLVNLLKTAVTEIETADPDGDGIPAIDDAFPLATTVATVNGLTLNVQPLDNFSNCSIGSLASSDTSGYPSAPDDFRYIDAQVSFTLENCDPGETVDIAIDFDRPIPERYQAFKVGTPWRLIPGSYSDGNTLHYRLTDGGPFDADGEANGVIIDPVTAGAFSPDAIPTNSLGGILLLILMLAGSAFGAPRLLQRFYK